MILVTVSLLVILVATFWLYNKHKFSYWAKRGVLSPPTIPFFGHLTEMVSTKRGRWVYDNEIYRDYNKNGLIGTYNFYSPILYVCDPEMIKNIFIKDFDHFTDRRVFKSPCKRDQCMNDMLSNENGEKWKTLRSIVSPTFTSGKMKNMFHLVCDKADALVAFSLAEAAKKSSVDMKFNFGRYTMDTIASCAFGLECNSLVEEDPEFPRKAIPFFDFGIRRMVIFILFAIVPKLCKILGMHLSPKEADFFISVCEETLASRRKGMKRGDFLDLLLDAQADESSTDPSKKQVLDDNSIIAQSILFIIAGYDTTATTLAFAAYQLAKNPEAQHRLRQELQDVVEQYGGITYQGIMESKYLEGVILETLRIYPPAPMLERQCTKEYIIPGTNVTVGKGQYIQVPVWPIHHDEKYWPEPEAFRPERFLPENKKNLTNYTHIPFGLGPRNCIAMRFAQMEAKVGISKLVLAADLKLPPGKEEVVLSTGAGLLKPEKELYLLLEPLNEE
ncbi:cytochrome P450 3A31-like [Macrobrachium rosenbergii]|uniref:cytochrome P450 3A31-like n=1 Tax=Macrobrachium rosenbergii TaxID=79674 RepID=UPI0034D7892E